MIKSAPIRESVIDQNGRTTAPWSLWLQKLKDSLNTVSGLEQSADPADPAEGQFILWQSDGTGAGDDGDIMIKITAGGVTKTGTVVDFSAL